VVRTSKSSSVFMTARNLTIISIRRHAPEVTATRQWGPSPPSGYAPGRGEGWARNQKRTQNSAGRADASG
jgi:hypothetical protein